MVTHVLLAHTSLLDHSHGVPDRQIKFTVTERETEAVWFTTSQFFIHNTGAHILKASVSLTSLSLSLSLSSYIIIPEPAEILRHYSRTLLPVLPIGSDGIIETQSLLDS